MAREMICSVLDLTFLGQLFGMTMFDENDNGSILCLRDNHGADFEGKDDNVFMNK